MRTRADIKADYEAFAAAEYEVGNMNGYIFGVMENLHELALDQRDLLAEIRGLLTEQTHQEAQQGKEERT